MESTRETRLMQVFVELADTLVGNFDLVDFLHLLAIRAVELLDVGEAGLLLADLGGTLQVMTSSSERTTLLELFQLQNLEGPCLECYHSGQAVVSEDLEADRERWPTFAPEARAAGFASVHALPLRLREEVIGALNLFRPGTGPLNAADAALGQAMADVASIGILQQRAIHEGRAMADELQEALNSRIVIEQAKGVLAEHSCIELGDAFQLLRGYARHNRVLLSQVARDLIDGRLGFAELSASGR